MTPIEIALVLLLVHATMGALDTFYSHEWKERLPSRPRAATELALHSIRSGAFAVLFFGLAWYEWRGAWAWAAVGLIAFEYLVTVADSVVEDRTRVLAPLERINHMLLAVNTGLYAAFVTVQAVRWSALPSALSPTRYPWLSELLTACAAMVAVWMVRDGWAAWRESRASGGAKLHAA